MNYFKDQIILKILHSSPEIVHSFSSRRDYFYVQNAVDNHSDRVSSLIWASRKISFGFKKNPCFYNIFKIPKPITLLQRSNILSCPFKGQPITDVVGFSTRCRAERSFFPSSILLTAWRIPRGPDEKIYAPGECNFSWHAKRVHDVNLRERFVRKSD